MVAIPLFTYYNALSSPNDPTITEQLGNSPNPSIHPSQCPPTELLSSYYTPTNFAYPMAKHVQESHDAMVMENSELQGVQQTMNSLTSDVEVYQQYPFVAQVQPVATNSPSHLDSSGSSISSRSCIISAEGSFYTCAYYGCYRRFDTLPLLKQHRKRHRRSLTVPRPDDITSSLLSQAGPPCCYRIDPSTGKPCNAIFKRPYDLTRHEDKYHNARKQFRCDVCTEEERTFTRADGLKRHYRVLHPDIDLPGKLQKGKKKKNM